MRNFTFMAELMEYKGQFIGKVKSISRFQFKAQGSKAKATEACLGPN